MRDTAIQIIGLRSLRMDAWDVDDIDKMVDLDEEIGDVAHGLALQVIDHDPFEGHTRLGEVAKYAHQRGICMQHAVVELVNKALSLGLHQEA